MKTADVSSLRMLRRAKDRIDRGYAEQIGIPLLAAGAGYSREHFIRAFRSAYGETPFPAASPNRYTPGACGSRAASASGGPGEVAQAGSPAKSAPIPDGWRDDPTVASPPHAQGRVKNRWSRGWHHGPFGREEGSRASYGGQRRAARVVPGKSLP